VIVLGHAILPHNHQHDPHRNCQISIKENLTLAQILALTLSHDLGAQHLEVFRTCSYQEVLPFSTSTQVFLLPALEVLLREHTFSPSIIIKFSIRDPKPQYHLPGTGLRAPPALA
jgi:hypothetical protein